MFSLKPRLCFHSYILLSRSELREGPIDKVYLKNHVILTWIVLCHGPRKHITVREFYFIK